MLPLPSAESLVVSGSQLPQESPPTEGATADPGVSDVTSGGDAASVLDPPPGDDIEYKTVEMCLIFGGMDTEGEIFDDCLVYLIS